MELHQTDLKRTPKKEKAMTMLDLPLKKKQKQTHHNRSETLLTPPEGQSSGYATFKSIHTVISPD